MSEYDLEVFFSGGEDSDIYSHSEESRHFGAPESGLPSDHLADFSSSSGTLNSSPDAVQYDHAESDGSINFTDHSLESPTEIWDSDNSLSLHLLPDDSDQVRAQGLLTINMIAQTQVMKSLPRPHVVYVNHTFSCFVKVQR